MSERATVPRLNRKTTNPGTDDRTGYPVRLLSIGGACKYLSCSSDLLKELISLGEIKVIRLGREPKGKPDRRKRWFDRRALNALVERKKCKQQ